jgi:CRISPR-associated protein Cas1
MAVVYVREQGATVRKEGEQLRVIHKDRELFKIPMVDLEQLVLMGNVQVTTQAAALLMARQVDVVFLSQFGKYRGRLLALESKHAKLRHAQLRLCDDPGRCLQVARDIVLGKVTNQRVVLRRRAGDDTRLRSAVGGMARMLDAAASAPGLDQLRGYEGKAAAFYFAGIRAIFPQEWGFKERAYHPPPDPLNALLSFAYMLLLKDVETKIQLVGLDPYLGIFHALEYDRPGLALDVMEEFRPSVADTVVLNLTRQAKITLADFERTNDPELPVRMTRQAMDIVVNDYEERMAERIYHPLAKGQVEYRRAIELQVRQLSHIVQGQESRYYPLVIQ